MRRRAEFYYQQFDGLRTLRQEVRRELLAEAQKHKAWRLLRQIPFIGPIRAALLIALIAFACTAGMGVLANSINSAFSSIAGKLTIA